MRTTAFIRFLAAWIRDMAESRPEGDAEMCTTSTYQPTAFVLNEMRKKLDLEQFQRENPGMDFSRAKLMKKYDEKYLDRMKKEISNQLKRRCRIS